MSESEEKADDFANIVIELMGIIEESINNPRFYLSGTYSSYLSKKDKYQNEAEAWLDRK